MLLLMGHQSIVKGYSSPTPPTAAYAQFGARALYLSPPVYISDQDVMGWMASLHSKVPKQPLSLLTVLSQSGDLGAASAMYDKLLLLARQGVKGWNFHVPMVTVLEQYLATLSRQKNWKVN
jgi:hypothetical protein